MCTKWGVFRRLQLLLVEEDGLVEGILEELTWKVRGHLRTRILHRQSEELSRQFGIDHFSIHLSQDDQPVHWLEPGIADLREHESPPSPAHLAEPRRGRPSIDANAVHSGARPAPILHCVPAHGMS